MKINEMFVIPNVRCSCGHIPRVKELGWDFGTPMIIAGCLNKECRNFARPWLFELMAASYVTKDGVQLGEQKL